MIIAILMSLPANSTSFFNQLIFLLIIGSIFPLLCMAGNLWLVSDIMYFTMSDTRSFCFPLSIKIYSGMWLSYLETIWSIQVLLLRYARWYQNSIKSKVNYSSVMSQNPFWVLYPMPYELWSCPAWLVGTIHIPMWVPVTLFSDTLKWFFLSLKYFPHTHAPNSTPLNIRMELRSLNSPPCSPLSSGTLYPELLLFLIPSYPGSISPTQRVHQALPGVPLPVLWSENSLNVVSEALITLTPLVSHLSRINIVWRLVFLTYFILFSSCFTWEGKSSPCYSFLFGSRSCKSICNLLKFPNLFLKLYIWVYELRYLFMQRAVYDL